MADVKIGNEIYNTSTGVWTNTYTGQTRTTPGYTPEQPSGVFIPSSPSGSASQGLETTYLPGYIPGQPSGNGTAGGTNPPPAMAGPQIIAIPTKAPEGIGPEAKAEQEFNQRLLNAGVSPSKREYLARTMGIAPSSTNEQAFKDYVAIANRIPEPGTTRNKAVWGEYNKVRLLANSQGKQASDVKNLLVSGSGSVIGFTTVQGQDIITADNKYMSFRQDNLPLSKGMSVRDDFISSLQVAKPTPTYDIRQIITPTTPREAVLMANIAAEGTQVSKQGFYAFLDSQAAYEQKLKDISPEGSKFGFGAKERFNYAQDVAFGKSPTGAVGFTKGVSNMLLGFFPSAADIGAQAVLNTPEAGTAYLKNPLGFTAGVIVGTGGLLWGQGVATIESAKKGARGDAVALGETAALAGIVAAPFVFGKTGRPRIETYTGERSGFSPLPEAATGKVRYVNIAWERGPSAKVFGGVEVETSGATGAGIRVFKGLPNAPDVGLFEGGRAQSPVASAVASKFMGQYGERLNNLKGPERVAYNKLVSDYAKGAEPAERGFIQNYAKGPGKTVFTEGKTLTQDSQAVLAKRGNVVMEKPADVFAGAKKLQEPTAETKTSPGERILNWVKESNMADVFGTTAQRLFMGKKMGRGYEGDFDLIASQPKLTESLGQKQMPTFGKVTAGGIAETTTEILKPSFKPGEIVAEKVGGEYTGLVNRGKQGHVIDAHDYGGGSYEPGTNPEYLGFGEKATKPFRFEGVNYQTLKDQSIAKGESAFRPNRLGALPEAHRFKDVYDAWDIARFAAEETGNVKLAKQAEAFKAKIPKDMLDYYKAKGAKDTPAQKFANELTYSRGKAYVGRPPSPSVIIASAASIVKVSVPSMSLRSPVMSSPYKSPVSSKPSVSPSSLLRSLSSPSPSPSKPSPSPYSPGPSSKISYPSSPYSPSPSPSPSPKPSYSPSPYPSRSPPSSPPSSKSSYVPPPPRPPPPTWTIPNPSFGNNAGKAFKKATSITIKTYRPSLVAVARGITGKAPKTLTGFEIRPIVINKAKPSKILTGLELGRKK